MRGCKKVGVFIGFEKVIVEVAEKFTDFFLKSGQWSEKLIMASCLAVYIFIRFKLY
jgi:hypothetical protein